MEKKLFKKISLNLLWIALILILILSLGMYKSKKDSNLYNSNELLEETVLIYEEINKISEGKESIKNILKSFPTLYENAIFAIDLETGEILGATENNEQELNFYGIDNTIDFLEKIKSLNEGALEKVNGEYKFVKSKIVDDFILICFFDANETLTDLIYQVIKLILVIGLIFIMIIIIIKRYFKKYVFNNFDMIENTIKEIVSGNQNITFNTENSELKSLIITLNEWRDSYKYKSSRMINIINGINSDIAVFECLNYIDTNFFSDNFNKVLGIDITIWNKIKNNYSDFEKYIKDLISLENKDGLIYVNNKYLYIKVYDREKEFFGFIIDKTDEVKNKIKIDDELKKAKEAAKKDNLTGLLNRNGFEQGVINSLIEKPGQGIMMLFDLDNFKKINDKLGHPEGDEVLKLIGNYLKREFKKSEIIGRLGGDEFVVFIDSNIPKAILKNRLNNILKNIRKELQYYYYECNTSMSIGIAYVDNKFNSYEDLYKCADVGLYIAKELGKDRYYINEDNIRCMRNRCIECVGECKKRKLLNL